MPRTMKDEPFVYKTKTVTAPVGFTVMNALISADGKKVVITFYRRKKGRGKK